MEGNLFYSVSTDLSVNLIPKKINLHRNIQNDVSLNIWLHVPVKLTCKINHHTRFITNMLTEVVS